MVHGYIPEKKLVPDEREPEYYSLWLTIDSGEQTIKTSYRRKPGSNRAKHAMPAWTGFRVKPGMTKSSRWINNMRAGGANTVGEMTIRQTKFRAVVH